MTDLTEFQFLPEVSPHVTTCTPWTPARVEEYDVPPSFPLEFRRSCAFTQRFIYRLSDVIAAPRTGAVLIPGADRLMGESCGALLRAVGWGDVRPDLLARPRRPTWDHPVVLSPPSGYYHWLLEVLPRLLAARDVEPEVRALIPDDCPGYVTEALRLLGLDVVETNHRAVRLRDVLVPAALQSPGFIPTIDVDRIRSTVLPLLSGMDGTARASASRVYVSRAKDSRRSLGNEPAIEDLMRELGFDVLYLQDLKWAEQVHRMSAAQIIVAPHGAGLANLIWSTELTAVVEIFPDRTRNDCYAHLALQQGVRYAFLVADQDALSSGTADLARLRALVSTALDTVARRASGTTV